MSQSRSPIDRLIDEAVNGKLMVRTTAVLECPSCGVRIPLPLDETEPPGTAKVRFPCNRCEQDGAIPAFFDDQGRKIDLNGDPVGASD